MSVYFVNEIHYSTSIRMVIRFSKSHGETDNIGVLKIRNRVHPWSSGKFRLFLLVVHRRFLQKTTSFLQKNLLYLRKLFHSMQLL